MPVVDRDSANDDYSVLARETNSSIEVQRTKIYMENTDESAGGALILLSLIDARLRDLFLPK
jgi:hypothetical protein